MANPNRAEFVVDFKSQGLEGIEKEVKKLHDNIKSMVDNVNKLQLSEKVIQQFERLNKEVEIITGNIDLFKNSMKELSTQKFNTNSLVNVSKELLRMTKATAKAKNQFNVLEQGVSQTTKGMETLIKSQLDEFEKLTQNKRLVKELADEFKKLQEIEDKKTKIEKSQEFKKALKDRIELLNKYKSELERINNLNIDNTIKDNMIGKLKTFEKAIESSDIKAEELNKDFEKLGNRNREIEGLAKNFAYLKQVLSNLRMSGLDDKNFKKLNSDLDEFYKTSLKLGNAKAFNPIMQQILELNREFELLTKNSQKFGKYYTEAMTTYYKASFTKGLDPRKVAQFGEEYKQMWEKALKSGDITPLKNATNQMKQLINTTMGLSKAKYTFESLRKELERLGTDSKVLAELDKEFKELQKVSYIFGNTKPLGELFSEMRKLKSQGNLSKTFDKVAQSISQINREFRLMEKELNLPADLLQELAKEFEVVKKRAIELNDPKLLKDFNAKIIDTINNSLRLADVVKKEGDTYEILLEEMKNYSRQENAIIHKSLANYKKLFNELDRQINNYQKTIKNLRIQLSSRENFASSKAIKEAENLLRDYEKELEKLEALKTKVGNNMALGNIDVSSYRKLKDELSGVTNEMKKYDLALQNVKAQLQETSFGKFLQHITKMAIGYSALYMGIYQVVNVIKSGIGYMVEFDKALHQISAIFNVNIERARYLETQLSKLGAAYGGNIQEINQVALALGRAGVETNKLVEATEYVIKMSKLTGDTFEASANALISYMSVYKNAGVTTKQLADELTYVANASRLSTEDINTFANYALLTAKSANIARHMIDALAIAFNNAGMNASTIGTNIRRLGMFATDSSNAIQRVFNKLGISQGVFAKLTSRSLKDSEKMWRWFIKRLKDMTDSEFQDLTAGLQVLDQQTLSSLRQTADEVLRHWDIMNKGVAGQIDQANIMMDSYIGTWERLKNSIGLAFTNLATQAMPTIQKLGNSLIDFTNKFANAMPKIIDNLKTVLHILEAIGVFLAGKFIVRGITAIVAEIGAATAGAGAFAAVLTGIRAIIGTITALFTSSPWGAILTATAMAAVAVYEGFKDANSEIEKTNSLLAVQNGLNKLIAEHDALIAQKQTIKRQLAMALVQQNGDLVKKYTEELNKINAQLEKYNQLIAKQKEMLKNKNKELEKAQKYIEYMQLTDRLHKLQVEYDKTHNQELLKEIQLLQVKKEQMKEIANYQPNLKYKTQTTTIHKPTYNAYNPYDYKIKFDMNEPVKFSEALKAIQIQAFVVKKAIGGINTALDKMKGKTPKEVIDGMIDFAKNTLKAAQAQKELNKQIKETAKTAKEIPDFVSDDELNKIQYLMGRIKSFQKAGLDVSDMQRQLNKLIGVDFVNSLRNMSAVMQNDLAKAGIDLSKLPPKLANQLKQVQKQLNNIKSPESFTKLQANIIRLILLFRKFKGSIGKDVADPLSAMIEDIDNKANKLAKLVNSRVVSINTSKAINNYYHIPPVKLELIPTIDKNKFRREFEEINRLNKEYRKQFQITMSMKKGNNAPIVDELKEAKQELAEIASFQYKVMNERDKKEQEYLALVSKIRAMNIVGFKDEKQAALILKRKTDLEKELKSLAKDTVDYRKKVYQLEIKIEKLKQKQIMAQREVLREARDMNDMQLQAYDNYVAKMGEIAKKLSLNSYNPTPENEAKMKAYFEYQYQYMAKIKKDLKEKYNNMEIGISNMPNVSGEQGVDSMIAAGQYYQENMKQLKEYFAQRKAVIQEEQLNLKQMYMAGKLSEAEYYKRTEQLKTLYARQGSEERKRIAQMELNTTLSIVSGMMSDLTGAMQQMMAAGYMHNKKWFRIYKALRVATTIIDTYAAAQKAMASPYLPYPINMVAAGLAITTGLMRLAVIKAQTFHTGGYVDRDTANKKMGGLKDDEIPAILQKGEYVLTKEEVKAIKSAGSTTPQVNVESPAPEIVILNSVDENAMGEYLQSRKGREIVRNVVGK